jgi:hypothetical protein
VVGFVALVAFVLAMEAVGRSVDRARFPWGYPEAGRPALAGTWVGPLVTASGQRLGMLMELELAPLSRGHRRHPPLFRTRRSRWLEGRVLVCTIPGGVRRLEARGRPDDTKTASTFHLGTTPVDSVAPEGLSPSTIKGRWGGGDTIDLSVALYMRKGKSSISSTSDPDTGPEQHATLERGTEAQFNSLCSGR